MRTKEFSLVKLLVRRAGSNRFLKETGRWTRKAEAAFSFPSPISAVNTCLGKGLQDVELVLRFENDHEDRCLPLRSVA
jgi:hypothetical protein